MMRGLCFSPVLLEMPCMQLVPMQPSQAHVMKSIYKQKPSLYFLHTATFKMFKTCSGHWETHANPSSTPEAVVCIFRIWNWPAALQPPQPRSRHMARKGPFKNPLQRRESGDTPELAVKALIKALQYTDQTSQRFCWGYRKALATSTRGCYDKASVNLP